MNNEDLRQYCNIYKHLYKQLLKFNVLIYQAKEEGKELFDSTSDIETSILFSFFLSDIRNRNTLMHIIQLKELF